MEPVDFLPGILLKSYHALTLVSFRAGTRSAELQIIFTVVSVFTKENFNPFSNVISPFGIGTHEIQWLFSIFLTHNWSPIYLLS